jgi:putative ABC transport system permease protein
MSELRHALRRLSRTPGFTALAVVTLALGIGASTALFSLVERVLLRPLAFRDPGQLVWLRESTPTFGAGTLPINAYHFEVWRERARTFAALSIVAPGAVTLTGRARPEALPIVDVSAGFFEMLGTTPALGRTFVRDEETEGKHHVVVLSEALWRREFAADPAVIGRTIQLDHVTHTVVGVLPAEFQYPRTQSSHDAAAPALYRPNVFSREELGEKFGRHNYSAIGRLRPGTPVAQGVAELNQLGADIVREIGAPGLILRAEATPLHEAVVGRSRRALWMLFGAVTAVLLIGCVNLMNFLLAQAEQRRQDSAVRQALGATRARLLRQSLIEALLVAAAGGALGLALAQAGLVTLLHRLPANLPRLAEVRLDGGVLLFALATSLLTALLFGLVPAWRTARTDPQQALAASHRTVAGGSRGLAGILVATEVTISLVLLVTAALLGASFTRLLRTDKGFRATQVLTAEVSIPLTKYAEGAQRLAFFERTLQELEAVPGVRSVAMINALPLQGETWIEKAALVGDPRPMAEKPNVNARFINSGYFETLGVPLRGRGFTAADRNRPVTIVSETLARILWPGQEPIGQRIERWPGDSAEVIGVAGDIRVAANLAPLPMVYRPYWAWPPRRMMVAVRTLGPPQAVAAGFHAALHRIDPDLPVPALRTMDDILAGSLEQERFQLTLAAVFAGAALLLTALGLSGVVAYSVTRRRKELGIRLALGATPAAVQRLVFRQSMRPVWIGLAAGTVIALAIGHVLGSLLFETRAGDPRMLGGTIAALAAVAALACYLPGRRATEVDPMTVLRDC